MTTIKKKEILLRKTATRNDQRAKESEIAKDVKMKRKKFWSYVEQKTVLQTAILALCGMMDL